MIGAKRKTLEAHRPLDQNAEIESEKIDCLHRPCLRPPPRGKIESVRTHSEVIEQFDSVSLLNSCFLLETDIANHERLLLAKWHPKPRKNCEYGAKRHEKLYGRSRLYASAQGHDETGGVLSLFFESFLWYFNKKRRAEVIFRLSRPISWKNQGKWLREAMISPRSPLWSLLH